MRRLAPAVLACLAGAGLALYAVTRVWSEQVTDRPGLSPLRATTTGADDQPWLVGLALVALAGAGALLATRGVVRRGLGALLTLVGLGIITGAVTARLGLPTGSAAGAAVWPVLAVLGGALVVFSGVGAARHGREWPTMGARYDRSRAPSPPDRLPAGPGPSPAAGPAAGPAQPTRPVPTDATRPDVATARPGEPVSPSTRRTGAPVSPSTRRAGADGSPGAGERGSAIAADGSAGSGAATGAPESGPAAVDTRAVWDALDRGDDPTAR